MVKLSELRDIVDAIDQAHAVTAVAGIDVDKVSAEEFHEGVAEGIRLSVAAIEGELTVGEILCRQLCMRASGVVSNFL